MNRLADFLTHHNAVPIALGFLFLAGGTALAASPAARDAVIGGAVTETVGVDNSAITDAALDRFDAHMAITSVTEDAQNYYVAYQYRTFSVEGSAWREIQKDGALTVAKAALPDGDLKAYAIGQLRQVVESDLAYLRRAQSAEIANGRSESRVTTSYHGLAGLAIEMKDALLPPVPVVPEPDTKEQSPPAVSPISVAATTEAATTTAQIDSSIPAETTTTDSIPSPQAGGGAITIADVPPADTLATSTATTTHSSPEATVGTADSISSPQADSTSSPQAGSTSSPQATTTADAPNQ
jgi:hypothetical protein